MESRHDSENADRVLRIMSNTAGGAKHLVKAIVHAHGMSSCQAFEVARMRQQLIAANTPTTPMEESTNRLESIREEGGGEGGWKTFLAEWIKAKLWPNPQSKPTINLPNQSQNKNAQQPMAMVDPKEVVNEGRRV